MDFEIYADESGLEALKNKEAHTYCAIGGIWIPAENRIELKESLKTIKLNYNVHGELKWKKMSPSFFNMYKDVIDYFFNTTFIRFRVILVEANLVDNVRFNNTDAELGFYKFYYQLLHHWIYDFNSYDIYLDHKVNRKKSRFTDLEKVLDNSNLTSDIKRVQGLPSHELLGIQLADVLTGLVASKMNGGVTSNAKLDLIKYIEDTYLNKSIAPTPKWKRSLIFLKLT
jgi:hypothetical protein